MNFYGAVALILAAGSGTRFSNSGGGCLKQLTPWKKEPVINRLVRQLRECGSFSKIVVVLGDNKMHQDAIKDSLSLEDVDFIVNPSSADDNNLLSFKLGVADITGPVLVVESDVVVNESDLTSMIDKIGSDEIRWGELGDISNFTHGGLIEVDPISGEALSINVLSKNDFNYFKTSNRKGVKMFGLTAFGVDALLLYKSRLAVLPDVYNKYFHHVAINEPELFRLTTYRVSAESFSFNTISELPQ